MQLMCHKHLFFTQEMHAVICFMNLEEKKKTMKGRDRDDRKRKYNCN